MSDKKLAPAVAACGAALALLAAPATAATAQTTTTATGVTQGGERENIKCIRPGGKETNYSWKDGNSSTTVYFNNHCSHRVYAQLHFKGPAGTRKECLATNGGTSGKKKFSKGLAENLTKITKDC
ncbi:hypothetical protein ACIBF6_14355 [Streptosporangium amethystogenes]|uniref:hypothetical protein n=1 Tax=Streptosporangium amethystogenes TaxID=2002 RepID=UPI0037A577EE